MDKENIRFSSVRVERLRGIKSADVQDLSRINVFFGKNNCGKSTLLESIFLLAGQSNPSLPVRINMARGYRNLQNPNDVSIEFYDLDASQPILIESTGSESRHLEISLIRSNSHTVNFKEEELPRSQMSEAYFGVKLRFGGNKASEMVFMENSKEDDGKSYPDARYRERLNASLISPRNSSVVHDIVEGLAKIIANKQKDSIISALRTIEPKLVDLLVVGDNILVDIGQDKYLPIQLMGDGMWRILSTIVHIYECKQGIILIDEVDNGLHPSAMPLLWKSIFTTAIENDVQVFVTTHNIDSIKGLNNVITENNQYAELMSSYKLIKTDSDEMKAVRYDAAHLGFMVEQDIEMR